MNNPKTTISGYVALIGTLLIVIGGLRPTSAWGDLMIQLGALLSGGGASIAAIAARDGGH